MAIQSFKKELNDSSQYNYRRVRQKFLNEIYNKNNYSANNLVEVVIYLESNTITVITEQADYEIGRLMSDLGGVVGLYIGMTLASFCELFELLALLL